MICNEKLCNHKLEKAKEERVLKEANGREIRFVVVGDLSLDANYDSSVLAYLEDRLILLDGNNADTLLLSDIKETKVKRMYGNSELRATLKEGKVKTLLRFTYKVASVCDAVATFINAAINNEKTEEAIATLEAAFEKNRCVCQKCGRALLHPGAPCIKCEGKGKLASKLLKYVAPRKYMLIFCLVLSVISTSMALVPPYITKEAVDTIIPSGDKGMLTSAILYLLGAYLIQHLVGIFRGYFLRITGDRIVRDLRDDVYEKAQYLPMSFYDKTSTGSVINRISGDCSTLQQFVLRISQEVVVQLFLLIGIVVIMFALNWKLSLISLLPVPLVVIGTRIFGKKIRPFYRRIWKRWSAVSSILTDTIPCIRVVKAFASEKKAVKRFSKYNNDWATVSRKSAKITTSFPQIVSFVVSCGSLLIWSLGGSMVIDSGGATLSLGLLVSFISYTSMFYGPVNFFANFSDSYQHALASAERVLDILDAEPEVNFKRLPMPEKVEGKIEFKNVSFSFDKSKKVLDNINLTINAGDVVGIVGTTGSGKSTLVNLMMRFYDRYDGDILLDGVDIRDIDMSQYRASIGYVQQEPMMFSDTIFNNVAYGMDSVSVEDVFHAAEVANAHDFIVAQPDGYDSMLGERGVGLSGGEKQRLSIARAVLKNPSILIFDEATASVDSETESSIQEAIDRLISGRTTIMIAHRLSTLKKANKIIVVDGGKIIEEGSHDELIEKKGKYYKLIEIQSLSERLTAAKKDERFN